MTTACRAVADAVRFLTVLPVPGDAATMEGAAAARAVAAFPLAGLVVGAAGCLGGWAAHLLWGAPVHAVAVVACWALVTGGLHLDGMADTCDAAWSWRPRERKLEILRDSRVGALGALGLVLTLLALVSALLALGARWWVGALLAPVWGRWAGAYGIVRFVPAREEGLGASVAEPTGARHLGVATVLAAGLAGVAMATSRTGPEAILAALPVWLVTEGLGRWLARSFGGLTGDAYGALCVAGEVVVLLWLGAWYRHPDAGAAVARWLVGIG